MRSGSGLAAFAISLWLGVGVAPFACAGTYYVDASSPNCSPIGSGTEAQPYCSISAAVTYRSSPGNTIIVKPGVYREQVDIRASGALGNPIVLKAVGPGVVVDATDDFSNPTAWEPSTGKVWVTDGVTWDPAQVLVDGVRLADSTGASGPLPVNAFAWLSGQGLYVNLGGGNPGTRQTLVGRRNYGFNMAARSWITIEGFTIRHAESRGIYMQGGCTDISLLRNTISFSNESGIHAVGGSNILIEGNVVSESGPHGIALTAGATNCTLRDNESYLSVDPDIRKADGIYLFDAPDNVLYRNRTHDNQDSGIHFGPGSNNCIAYNNRSWNNGDHGFDHLGSTGTIHTNDVSSGNFKDGFSIEAGATGTRLHNCIAVNNGLTTDEFDLWVDTSSATGFVSDHNLFWNAVFQEPVKFGGVKYTTVAAYIAASGQDTHSIEADPRFVNPGAGDFHLLSGSPAIDTGDSGAPYWPATDVAGAARVDVPAMPNTGEGSVTFVDLGVFEYQTAPPVARLTVTPASGTAPLTVTADASASSDPDGTAASYRFEFGDGTFAGPQPSPVAIHTYANSGNRTVTVTMTDSDGLTDTEVQSVAIASPLRAALTLSPATGNDPLLVVGNAAGSTDTSSTIVSYRFAFGDGTTVGPQASPTATHVYASGTWRATVTVLDAIGESSTATMDVIVADVDPGQNRVGNPSWESDSLGWMPENAVMARIAGGFDGGRALRIQGPATTSAFGITDAPHWIASTPAAHTRYRFRAWVRSASAGGSVRLRIRELDRNGRQLGPLVQSYPVRLSSTWQGVAVEYLSEGAGSSIDFGIVDSPVAAGEGFDVDNVSIHVILGDASSIPPIGGESFVPPVLFPNPMADRASLRFSLSQAGPLKVEIFDVTGRIIRTLADEAEVLPGQFEYPLDDRNDDRREFGAGVYFYRVQARERTAIGRFLTVK